MPSRRQVLAGSTSLVCTALLGPIRSAVAADVRAITARQGTAKLLEPGEPVITHCQGGGRASLEIFGLMLAGIEDAQNYYGGWMEWSANDEAPVEIQSHDPVPEMPDRGVGANVGGIDRPGVNLRLSRDAGQASAA